jgi:hypothetical protein
MMLSLDFSFAWALIYIHVALGFFLPFCSRCSDTIIKKRNNKNTGLVFYYSMVVSVALSLLVSLLPGHISPTMFHIAVLSLYFCWVARDLKFKIKTIIFNVDKALAFGLFLTWLSWAIRFIEGRVHPLRTVFGTIGLVFEVAWIYWMFSFT